MVIYYRQPNFHLFKDVEIRFGFEEMNPGTHTGVQFTDDHNPLCTIHNSNPPVAAYGVYRCEQVQPGQYLTIQKLNQGILEINEIDVRVMFKSGMYTIKVTVNQATVLIFCIYFQRTLPR